MLGPIEAHVPSQESEQSTGIDIEAHVPSQESEQSTGIDFEVHVPSQESEQSTGIDFEVHVPSQESEQSTGIDFASVSTILEFLGVFFGFFIVETIPTATNLFSGLYSN